MNKLSPSTLDAMIGSLHLAISSKVVQQALVPRVMGPTDSFGYWADVPVFAKAQDGSRGVPQGDGTQKALARADGFFSCWDKEEEDSVEEDEEDMDNYAGAFYWIEGVHARKRLPSILRRAKTIRELNGLPLILVAVDDQEVAAMLRAQGFRVALFHRQEGLDLDLDPTYHFVLTDVY